MGRGGPIWLVGMMGAGKSCVGRLLARELGVPFADSDEAVERAAGRTVPALFADEGEAAFRRRERDAVLSLAKAPGVVALGGGAPAQPEVAALLETAGFCVYLRARAQTLLGRLGACDGRPLLAGLDPEARARRLAALLAEREPSYARAALVVDTDALAPAEVVQALLRGLPAEARP